MCSCTEVNVAEVLLMSMTIAKKHSTTWELLLDVHQMINDIFDKPLLPTSKYMLRKLLRMNTDPIVYHLLCSHCNEYIGKKDNVKESFKCKCGEDFNPSTAGSYFIEIDIEDQLKKIFADEKIVESLSHRFDRKKKNKDALEDLYDGDVYKHYEKLGLLGKKNP